MLITYVPQDQPRMAIPPLQSSMTPARPATAPRQRRLAAAVASIAVGLGLLLSTTTTALGVIVEPLWCYIADRHGNITTTVKASDLVTRRLRSYGFEFDSEYFWSKASVKITLDVPSHLPSMSIEQTFEWPAEDGFAGFSVPFAIWNWFAIPTKGVAGKATVRLYDHSGFLDAKTCRFRLVP